MSDPREVMEIVDLLRFETDGTLTCEHRGCYFTGTLRELDDHVEVEHPHGIVRDRG